MKNIKRILSITCLLILSSVIVYAQGPGFDPDVEPYAAPLDGGAGLMIASGVVLILRKLNKSRNSKPTN